MNRQVNKLSFALSLVLLMSQALADSAPKPDSAFLDPPYPRTNRNDPTALDSVPLFRRLELPEASDTEAVIATQTPVKSQGARGTCSIFSATAIAENFLIRAKNESVSLDLSEEYLEYLVMRERTSEGSSSIRNFSLILDQGMPSEDAMPYIGETWKNVNDTTLSKQRCGHLQGGRPRQMTSCLLGHWDPQLLKVAADLLRDPSGGLHFPTFASAREEALESKKQMFAPMPSLGHRYLRSSVQLKELLARGVTVTLDIDFFYGAWNHRQATDLGIERKMNEWSKGIVTAPISGSLDAEKSLISPAGHSILIVGYDDEREVTSEFEMTDGTKKTVTFRGVYYFKNSWGQSDFGRDFEMNGKNYAGYGMITQEYADSSYGSYHAFYDLESLGR